MNAITRTLQGGASPAALLARSNAQIQKRHHWWVDYVSKLRTAAEAAFRADEIAGAEEENAKTDLLRAEEANRMVPGTVPEDQIAVLRDIYRRKQQLRLETRTALTHANAALHDAEEQVLAQVRLIASMKTQSEIPFDGWVAFDRPTDRTLGTLFADVGARIVAAASRKSDAKTAPRLADEWKRRGDAHIDAKAADGALVFVGLDGDDIRGPGFELPTIAINAEPDMTKLDQPRVIDTEALLCRFFGDQIKAELHSAIDAAYAGVDDALGPDERRKLIREADREIAVLERVEAAVFWAAVDAGEMPKIRPGMSARALLGIA